MNFVHYCYNHFTLNFMQFSPLRNYLIGWLDIHVINLNQQHTRRQSMPFHSYHCSFLGGRLFLIVSTSQDMRQICQDPCGLRLFGVYSSPQQLLLQHRSALFRIRGNQGLYHVWVNIVSHWSNNNLCASCRLFTLHHNIQKLNISVKISIAAR